MISCEGWQCVWRLAWHRLAPCRRRLSSCAKASITQIKEQGELEIAATGRWESAEQHRHNSKTNRGPGGYLSINAVS